MPFMACNSIRQSNNISFFHFYIRHIFVHKAVHWAIVSYSIVSYPCQ